MPVTVRTIIDLIEKIAPQAYAEKWDNVGLQTGSFMQPVRKVFLSLDLTEEVLAEAVVAGADMLVVHHSPFFRPLSAIRSDQAEGRLIANLIKSDMALYTAHTNLDAAQGGVNDVLAELFGLIGVKPLIGASACKLNEEDGLGRVGILPEPTSLQEFVVRVKETLRADKLRFAGDPAKRVEKVALCGGSGAQFLQQAAAIGADVYVTADLKYHDGHTALAQNTALIDPGHYAMELPAVSSLARYLQRMLADCEVGIVLSRLSTDPFRMA